MKPSKIFKRAYRRAFRQLLPLVVDIGGTEVEVLMSLKAWAHLVSSPDDDLGYAALTWLENKGARP